MSTLLRKALEIRRRLESETTFFTDSDSDLLKDIPDEERNDVLSQIDRAVSAGSIYYKPENFDFTPLHSDSHIPVIINIAAAAVIIILSVIFLASFNMDQEKIITGQRVNNSSEGKIIKVLLRESKEKMKAKESEIEEIRNKLLLLKNTQNQMKEDSENRMRKVENDLRLTMEKKLEEERLKLQISGITEEEMNKRLEAVYSELDSDYQREVEQSREKYLKEETARQEAIVELTSEYETMIGDAESELLELEKNITGYRDESEKNKIESSYNKQMYEKLAADTERKKLITEQIRSAYTASGEMIEAGDFDKASDKIADLEDYFQRKEIASLPFIIERRGMDILLIKSIKNLIDKERKAEIKTDESMIEAAGLINLIENRFTEGNIYYSNNDYISAEKFYSDASSVLPEMKSGINNLITIEKENYKKDLSARISLTEKEKSILAELSEKEKNRFILSENLEKLRRTIEITDEQKKERRQTLIPSLRTKLKIREILASGTVKNEDPDLYKKLEEYIRAYGRDKENSGREKGINEVNSIIRSLINSDVSVNYKVDENEELEFFFLLDGLEKLIGY